MVRRPSVDEGVSPVANQAERARMAHPSQSDRRSALRILHPPGERPAWLTIEERDLLGRVVLASLTGEAVADAELQRARSLFAGLDAQQDGAWTQPAASGPRRFWSKPRAAAARHKKLSLAVLALLSLALLVPGFLLASSRVAVSWTRRPPIEIAVAPR